MLRNCLFCIFSLFSCLSFAQDPTQKIREEPTADSSIPDLSFDEDGATLSKGWTLGDWKIGVDLGVNGNLTNNSGAQGVPGGFAIGVGGKFGLSANLKAGSHQWRNSLSIIESFEKSPETAYFVKAADQFAFDSHYLYALGGNEFGLFARFGLDSNLFQTIDVQGDDVDYTITNDITSATTVVTADHLTLNPSFSPMELSQSIGLWVRPVSEKWLHLEIFPGFMVVENFESGSFIITDITGDDTTGKQQVAVLSLDNYYQMAGSLAFAFRGVIINDLLSYRITVNPYYAFWRSSVAPLPGDWTNAINLKSSATVSLKLTRWLAVNYEFSGNRLPEQSDDFQMTNNVFLTFTNGLFGG